MHICTHVLLLISSGHPKPSCLRSVSLFHVHMPLVLLCQSILKHLLHLITWHLLSFSTPSITSHLIQTCPPQSELPTHPLVYGVKYRSHYNIITNVLIMIIMLSVLAPHAFQNAGCCLFLVHKVNLVVRKSNGWDKMKWSGKERKNIKYQCR